MRRVKNLIKEIKTSKQTNLKLRNIRILKHLITKHSVARCIATSEGIVDYLKKQTSRISNPNVVRDIRQILHKLGYQGDRKGIGLRVLTMDGGGMRGLVIVKILECLEEITGKRIHELFDFICAVSTGALIMYGICPAINKSLRDIETLYKELGPIVFKETTINGALRCLTEKGWYSTEKLHTILENHFGQKNLMDTAGIPGSARMCAVSSVSGQPFIFRNYEASCCKKYKNPGTSDCLLTDCLRATTAAPFYFKEHLIKNNYHQDGGVSRNNPTGIAIQEVRTLWPSELISCIVSIGTGNISCKPSSGNKKTSWFNLGNYFVHSATDTEERKDVRGFPAPAIAKEMAVMYSFCRYFSVRLGTILVAASSMVQSFVLGGIFLHWLNNLEQTRESLQDWILSTKLIYVTDLFQNIYHNTELYLLSTVVFLMFHICTSVLVIYAAIKCNIPLTWPYLVVEFLRLAFLFFIHVTAMMLTKVNGLNLGLLLVLSISGGFVLLGLYYNWFCVVSLCQCLQELKETQRETSKVSNENLMEFSQLKKFSKHMPAMSQTRGIQALYSLQHGHFQCGNLADPTY